jgi:hypothetical protein
VARAFPSSTVRQRNIPRLLSGTPDSKPERFYPRAAPSPSEEARILLEILESAKDSAVRNASDSSFFIRETIAKPVESFLELKDIIFIHRTARENGFESSI